MKHLNIHPSLIERSKNSNDVLLHQRAWNDGIYDVLLESNERVNQHAHGVPFDLPPRRLHAAVLNILQTKSLKELRVDGKSKKRKHFTPATAIDTIEYTFDRIAATCEIAVKVLQHCADGQDNGEMKLTPAMAAFVFSKSFVQRNRNRYLRLLLTLGYSNSDDIILYATWGHLLKKESTTLHHACLL